MFGGMAQTFRLLLVLSLEGVFAGHWSVHLPPGPICAVTDSSVILPCSYDYPQSANETRVEGQLSAQGEEQDEYKVLSEMWCLEDSRCVTPSYVFHSDRIFPEPAYQNRVQYLGEHGTKNCSLRISNLKRSDSGTYVFYLITTHPTEKMPAQKGIQLLVADSYNALTTLVSPSSGITEGEDLRLACCSPQAAPWATFRWYKKSNSSLQHSGQLWTISEVTPEDSDSFYCQLKIGAAVQNSTMLTIDIEYAPRNTTLSVLSAGEFPVTLTCSSDANPSIHTYSWYQGAACLPTEDKSFHHNRQTGAMPAERGSTISSANVTTDEYGLYCCLARNRHGSQTASVTLTGRRAVIPPKSKERKVLIIGVSIGILLAIIAIFAFLIRRGWKSSRHQSYILTQTSVTEI
ncbi:cell adhesion molecule 4 isoform 1-T2 [Pholidichthys leucotaenia]